MSSQGQKEEQADHSRQLFVSYRILSQESSHAVSRSSREKIVPYKYTSDDYSILKSFEEDKFGRRKNWPALKAALAFCRDKRANLLIYQFRSILRNASFLKLLLESDVDFIAVDMQQINRDLLPAFLDIAEHDQDRIRRGTRLGLEKAKARGAKLGNPRPDPAAARQAYSAQAAEFRAKVAVLIEELSREGLSLRAIANKMNEQGVPAGRGGKWHASSVQRVLRQSRDHGA